MPKNIELGERLTADGKSFGCCRYRSLGPPDDCTQPVAHGVQSSEQEAEGTANQQHDDHRNQHLGRCLHEAP